MTSPVTMAMGMSCSPARESRHSGGRTQRGGQTSGVLANDIRYSGSLKNPSQPKLFSAQTHSADERFPFRHRTLPVQGALRTPGSSTARFE